MGPPEEEIVETLAKALGKYRARVAKAVERGVETTVPVAYKDLAAAGPDALTWAEENPARALEAMDAALLDMAKEAAIGEIPKMRAAVVDLPPFSRGFGALPLRAARKTKHINKYICVEGMANNVALPKPLLASRAFLCEICDRPTYVTRRCSLERFDKPPKQCSRADCGGPLIRNEDADVYVDEQHVAVQEPPQVSRGRNPYDLRVVVKGEEFTGVVPAMSHVTAYGVLRLREVRGQAAEEHDYYLEARYVESKEKRYVEEELSKEDAAWCEEVVKKDPDIVSNMARSLVPYFLGHEPLKRALLLQQIRGKKDVLPDGTVVRDTIHLIWLGDPGVYKSAQKMLLLTNGGFILPESLIDVIRSEKGLKKVGGLEIGQLGKELPVFSLTPTGKVTKTSTRFVVRKPASETLIRVTTASGRSLLGDPKHLLFTMRDGKIAPIWLEDLSVGTPIATSRTWPFEGTPQKISYVRTVRQGHTNPIVIPHLTTPDLCAFVGYVLGDGYVLSGRGKAVFFTNSSERLRNIFSDVLYRCFGARGISHPGSRTHRTPDVVICSTRLVDFLSETMPTLLERSPRKSIPEFMLGCSNEEVAALLRALFDCEAEVSPGKSLVNFTTTSEKLARQVLALLMRFGIFATLHEYRTCATNTTARRMVKYYRLNISGYDNLSRFAERVGFSDTEKGRALEERLRGAKIKHGATDTIPGAAPLLKQLKKRLRCYGRELHHCLNQYVRGEKQPTRDTVNEVVARATTRLHGVAEIAEKEGYTWGDCRRARELLHLSAQELAERMGYKSEMSVFLYEKGRNKTDAEGARRAMESAVKAACREMLGNRSVYATVNALHLLANSDVRWDPVTKIERIKPEGKWVYDVQVEGANNCVTAEGIVSHNTKCAKRICLVSPVAEYVSCDLITPAAATAAWEKDELTGAGRLVAGALPRASGGFCALDELSRAKEEVLFGIRESLANQSITIHKAGLHETLEADTCVLGTSNPKGRGRLDTGIPPVDQLPEEIDETLLSRFDLYFVTYDRPEMTRDKRMAAHLMAIQRGMIDTKEAEPPVYTDEQVRKYIAYARSKKPKLTEEAASRIAEFYVGIRRLGERKGMPLPMGPRQVESMAKLATALAKARLKDRADLDDAEEAIDLLTESFRQWGIDLKTGAVDIDLIEGRRPKSKRDKMMLVLKTMERLDPGNEGLEWAALADELATAGVERGEVRELLDALDAQGDVHQPRADKAVWRRVPRA